MEVEANLVGVQSRTRDRSAAQQAAALSRPKQGGQRVRVLDALARLESTGIRGFTSEQIQEEDIEGTGFLYAIRIDILRRRITDLVQMGWVEAHPDKMQSRYSPVWLTRWTLTDEGRMWMEEHDGT